MLEVSTSLSGASAPAATDPLVTAVIPTRNRPELVTRAVRSALEQTYPRMEVVVVVDGPDAATDSALASIQDERLRVIRLPQPVGGSDARNVGVKAAWGEWIGLLDDDDEWMSQKIELQMWRASASKFEFPIISSRIIARTSRADYVWPRRLPHSGEPVADYLFCRKSLFQGEGLIHTSTIFTKRVFLMKVPFACGLKKHQDWDWVIRASNIAGAGVEFCWKSLAICHTDQACPTVGSSDDWTYSLAWIRDRRQDVTRRAYAAFVLIVVAAQAARVSTAKQYLALFSEALDSGSPTLLEIALFASMRLIPRGTRQGFRAALGGFQR
jgi:glycosyltransferase involved in cell wall biosynthesis